MKTMVITGAASGVGFETLKMLSVDEMHLIAIVRNESRAQDTIEALKGERISALIDFVYIDLASSEQIKKGVARIGELLESTADLPDRPHALQIGNIDLRAMYPNAKGIDALIHCAGTVSSWYQCTEDAYELQFAVNHLAVFSLTMQLLPFLKQSKDPRVIVVSSGSHYRTKIKWDDIMMRSRYSCLKAYKQSKLCNVLFVRALDKRYRDVVSSYAVDPGLVNTEIGLKGTSGIEAWVWKKRKHKGQHPRIPAGDIIRAAKDSYYSDLSGAYIKGGYVKKPSKTARKETEADKLWELSEKLCE